jgi:hypothetical protein
MEKMHWYEVRIPLPTESKKTSDFVRTAAYKTAAPKASHVRYQIVISTAGSERSIRGKSCRWKVEYCLKYRFKTAARCPGHD